MQILVLCTYVALNISINNLNIPWLQSVPVVWKHFKHQSFQSQKFLTASK